MIKELSEQLSLNPNILVADFSHINVDKISQLRKNLKSKSSKLLFVKNSIAKLALKQNKIDGISDVICGSAGLVFCGDDPIILSKMIFSFAKDNERLAVLGGYLDGKFLDSKKIKQISQLPSKKIILQNLLMTMNAPIYGFVNVLSANLKGIINIIEQIKTKKEGVKNE